jgi:hypothetical protein
MRSSHSVVRLLPLIAVFALLVLAGVRAQSPLSRRIYAPLIHDPGAPRTATPVGSATPTPTPTITPTSPPTVRVNGSVRLRPQTADLTPDVPNPQRYVLLLDVSGSQNLNFAGQGSNNGQVVQCAPGPAGAPPSQFCGEPQFAWSVIAERRIYVQKQAALRFINQLNMPGNATYNPNRPSDQLALVAYAENLRETLPPGFGDAMASNPAALKAAVMGAGAVQGDPFRVTGGTNWAVGLHAAAALFDDAPLTSDLNGTRFSYDDRVIVIVDGVANHFFNPNAPTGSGGISDELTFPIDHLCRSLGSNVVEDADCQTTEIGGQYNGNDRPITQALQIAQQRLLNRQDRSISVSVITIGHFSPVALRDGVASTPAQFFPAPNLTSANGLTVIEQAFDAIAAQAEPIACRPRSAAGWVESIAEANIPLDTGLPPGQLGVVTLEDAGGASYAAPILRNAANGALGFQYPGVPPGVYTLSLYAYYRGDDTITRRYAGVYFNDELVPAISIDVQDRPVDLGTLALVLTEDVCAGEG